MFWFFVCVFPLAQFGMYKILCAAVLVSVNAVCLRRDADGHVLPLRHVPPTASFHLDINSLPPANMTNYVCVNTQPSWRYCDWELNQVKAVVKYLISSCLQHVMKASCWSFQLADIQSWSKTISTWQCQNLNIMQILCSMLSSFLLHWNLAN